MDVLKRVMGEWEQKLEEAFRRSTEETALRLNVEHEVSCHLLSRKTTEHMPFLISSRLKAC